MQAREGQDLFIITAAIPVEACLSKRGAGGLDVDTTGGGYSYNLGGASGGAGEGTAGGGGGGLSFADELRKESAGAASVSISLSHWERLQVRTIASSCCRVFQKVGGHTALLRSLFGGGLDVYLFCL